MNQLLCLLFVAVYLFVQASTMKENPTPGNSINKQNDSQGKNTIHLSSQPEKSYAHDENTTFPSGIRNHSDEVSINKSQKGRIQKQNEDWNNITTYMAFLEVENDVRNGTEKDSEKKPVENMYLMYIHHDNSLPQVILDCRYNVCVNNGQTYMQDLQCSISVGNNGRAQAPEMAQGRQDTSGTQRMMLINPGIENMKCRFHFDPYSDPSSPDLLSISCKPESEGRCNANKISFTEM